MGGPQFVREREGQGRRSTNLGSANRNCFRTVSYAQSYACDCNNWLDQITQVPRSCAMHDYHTTQLICNDTKNLLLFNSTELKTEDDEKENESKTERRHGEQHGAGIEKRPQATQMAGKKWSGLELTAVCGPTPPTAEDSPVKSLRKWVDGCFHQRQTVLTDSPAVAHPDTPPSTPPHRQPTAEAAVITFGEFVRLSGLLSAPLFVPGGSWASRDQRHLCAQ